MKVQGIVVPLITPLTAEGRLDEAGLERLLIHVAEGGVHGVFVLGTTGEGPSLPPRLRRQVVQAATKLVPRDLPVYVGVSDSSPGQTRELADWAGECGAAAVVAAPPCYFPLGEEELFSYYADMARRVPLPLLLYNIPATTKVSISPALVARLAEVDNIAGVKDSSGNMVEFHQLLQGLREKPGFSLLMGTEQLIGEAVLLGADGGVPGGGNIAPALFVSLYEAAAAGELETLRERQQHAVALGRIYGVGEQWSRWVKAPKLAAAILGLCADYPAEPLERYGSAEREHMEKILDELRAHGIVPGADLPPLRDVVTIAPR